jgi:hypothetical protein
VHNKNVVALSKRLKNQEFKWKYKDLAPKAPREEKSKGCNRTVGQYAIEMRYGFEGLIQ